MRVLKFAPQARALGTLAIHGRSIRRRRQMVLDVQHTPAAAPKPAAGTATESLADRFYDLLTLPSDDLERTLSRFIRSEDELPDAVRYQAVLGRLRAWLELDNEDARVIAGAYERAIKT